MTPVLNVYHWAEFAARGKLQKSPAAGVWLSDQLSLSFLPLPSAEPRMVGDLSAEPWLLLYLFSLCVCVVLGFEFQASLLLGRCSTIRPFCQPYFMLGIFKMGVLLSICLGLALSRDLSDLCLLSN
jgi:hypothetical protein